MLPTPDAALGACRAFRFLRATLAVRTPVGVDLQFVFHRATAVGQAPSGRAQVFVVLGDVGEIELAVASSRFAVGGHGLGHKGANAGLFTSPYFLSRVVASIGQDLQ